MTGHGEDYQRR
jgi:pyroglutamyl-peptidase